MKLGITLPQSGKSATKENILKVAQSAENSGIDSLWVFERLLWPLKPQTPYPASKDGHLPEEYQVIYDPLQTLGFASAKTSKIQIGTCILDILFHNPVILAKSLATLDNLSDGRLIAGFGLGWMKDEFQASNIPFEKRGKRYDELIELIKKMWLEDIVSFSGVYYNLPLSKVGPKPKQKPYIPFFLGGFSPQSLSRIIKTDANGWLGAAVGQRDIIKKTIESIKSKALEANKNPEKFKIILLSYPQIVKEDLADNMPEHDHQRQLMRGSLDQIGSDIQYLKSVGVDHLITSLTFGNGSKDIEKTMDMAKQFQEFAKA